MYTDDLALVSDKHVVSTDLSTKIPQFGAIIGLQTIWRTSMITNAYMHPGLTEYFHK